MSSLCVNGEQMQTLCFLKLGFLTFALYSDEHEWDFGKSRKMETEDILLKEPELCEF